MSDPVDDLKEAVHVLMDAKDQIRELETWFSEHDPNMWEELQTIKESVPSLQSSIKSAMKTIGESKTVSDMTIKCSVGSKTVIDVDTLIYEARERGDLDELFKFGVISYSGDAKQVDRLPDNLKCIYSEFVRTVEGAGATRVTLPKELK